MKWVKTSWKYSIYLFSIHKFTNLTETCKYQWTLSYNFPFIPPFARMYGEINVFVRKNILQTVSIHNISLKTKTNLVYFPHLSNPIPIFPEKKICKICFKVLY